MARHRKRRHRGFRDYVSVPSLGGLKEYNPLGKHVSSTDVLVGASLGLALGAGVKYALNLLNTAIGGKIPTAVMNYASPISTFFAGAALYMLQRKSKRSRAEGHLVGASTVAAGSVVWNLLKSYGPTLSDGTPFFSDYVVTQYGLLTADSQMKGYGLISADRSLSGYAGAEDWDPMSAP